MPYRGYFELDGAELVNTSRVVRHLTPGTITEGTYPGEDTYPGADTYPGGTNDAICGCSSLHVEFDDSWTGLPALLGDPEYQVTNAPWYSAYKPESREFAGVWVMGVQGFESTPFDRDVQESVCSGGAAGFHRDRTKVLTFDALLIACSNAGVEYGLMWLNRELRKTKVPGGLPMGFFGAHPGGSSVNPSSLWRTFNGVVLTKPPSISDQGAVGTQGGNKQTSLYRVEWEMTVLSPYMYGPADTLMVDWDSYVVEQIEWVHAPDCATPGDCGLPVLFNAECVPATVDVLPAPIPTCGGCVPICAVTTLKWTLPSAVSFSAETAVTIKVTNLDPGPLSVSMWWQPCGSTDLCDRVNPLQISGLPTGATAVADSVKGRPYAIVGGNRVRQVGIVTTPTGAPWTPTVLDRNQCWELIAEATPDAEFTVDLVLQERLP